MSDSASTGRAMPLRIQAYVDAIVQNCGDGGRALVSVILFGSAATGGWVEPVSDVDLILVVPDGTRDEILLRLRREVERIELLHQLHSPVAHGQSPIEKVLNKVTAHDRSFFICTRGDLLSGEIGRIIRLHPLQAILVDRIVLANFVSSGVTVWGETLMPLVPVARIRRFDVYKSFFSLFSMALLCVAVFPLHPGMTKFAMSTLKSSVHSCFFCYELRAAPLEEECRFFERRLGVNRAFTRLMALRREYRNSFPFVIQCIPTLVRLHWRTFIDNPFPRAVPGRPQ